MERTIRDFRLAFKALRRRPLFAFLVIGTLALGIGVATSIFSVVNAVLLSGLSHADSEQLVMFRLDAGDVKNFPAASTGELELFQDESQTLSQVSGTGAAFTAYAVIDDEAVPLETALVPGATKPHLERRGFPTDFPEVGCARGRRDEASRRGFPTDFPEVGSRAL